jgi:hypothetical protein
MSADAELTLATEANPADEAAAQYGAARFT